MTKAIYPGSFNPLHVGHIDILRRASKLFEHITLLIAKNPNKHYTLSAEERKEQYLKLFKNIGLNVSIDILEGDKFIADYCKNNEITHIVKGIRNYTDFDNEMTQEWFNKGLNSDVETVYFSTRNEYRYLSSTALKQMSKMDRNAFINYMKMFKIDGLNEENTEEYLGWMWRNF